MMRAFGPDRASGVESGPGRKSPKLVREFIEAAQAAFARTSARP